MKMIFLVFLALMVLGVSDVQARAVAVPFYPDPGPLKTEAILPDHLLKGVVAEFLDPENTGLGKSMAYLVWRDVLTAIHDQSGAGVILAYPPGNQRLVDLLEGEYHVAAMKVASDQHARMAIWGAVLGEGNRVYVNTYLTIIPDAERAELMMHLVGLPADTGVAAEIPRTRFNFALLETSREQLFKRRLVARKKAVVRTKPEAGALVVAKLRKGEVLDAVDMDGGWFKVQSQGRQETRGGCLWPFGVAKVQLPDGAAGYVDNSEVDVPPQAVYAPLGLEVRSRPGTKKSVVGTIEHVGSTYEVLDMRYVRERGVEQLWYKIKVLGDSGWVQAVDVEPRFSLPVVHFVAGLYRYQLGRYKEARTEFSQFLESPGVESDNVSLAAAYQLLAASSLMVPDTHQRHLEALKLFSKAIDATPYDPAAYNLRALSTLALWGWVGSGDDVLSDLEKALTLDPQNKRAQELVSTLSTFFKTGAPEGLRNLLPYDENKKEVPDRLRDLTIRFRIGTIQ